MRFTQRIIFVFYVFFILNYGAIAQQSRNYSFNHLSMDDGLSNSSIYCIIQDHQGYLWFGSADGLNKYDGDKFTIYRHEPFNSNSLSVNWITTLAVDNSNNLWIGTYGGGLNHFNTKTKKFTSFLSSSERILHINNDVIRTLYFSKQSEILWIGTDSGLNTYDVKNSRFKLLPLDSSSISNLINTTSINAIFQRDSILWIGTWGSGIIRMNLNTSELKLMQFHRKASELRKFNLIKSIEEASETSLWVGSRGGGVFELDEKDLSIKRHFLSENSELNNDMIYSIKQFKQKQFWVGTYYNGLNLFDIKQKKWQNFTASKYDRFAISGNWIPGVFIDRTNILWIGTDNGVSYLPLEGVGFNHFTLNNSNLSLNFEANINALCEDSIGNIWLGTWGHGLIKFNPKLASYKQYIPIKNKNSIQTQRVWTILRDKNGLLWIGTASSLDVFNPKTEKFFHYSSYHDNYGYGVIPVNNISAMCFHGDSSIIVGTWGGGITTINTETKKVLNFDNSNVKGNRIKSLFVDSKNRLWIGSANDGISVYNFNDSTWRYLAYSAGNNNTLSGNDIEDIVEDENYIWVATNNSGLNRIEKATFRVKHIFKEDGLASNSLRRIVIDNNGNLWISSQEGISKYNPITEEFRNFDQTDGLQSNEFNRGSAYLKSGEIAFGGNNGFNTFHPERLNINKTLPKIVISKFYKQNKEINIQDELSPDGQLLLHTSDNMISFEFRALDFSAPSKNKYLYKLEGFDEAWRKPMGEPLATYTNLPAGKYIFRVIASNNHGFWNTDGVSLKVRVFPPIYFTWQFYVALFLVLSVLFIAYLKKRELYLRQAALRLERLVDEKTEEIRLKNTMLKDQNSEIILQNEEIEVQTQEALAQRDAIQEHRDLIQEQQQELTDSILYAQTIQMAMMPDQRAFNALLPKSFLLFMPKDIVSGDFVWLKEVNNLKYIAVADCTGHGVPGGFLSMFGISILNELVLHENMTSAAEILEGLRNRLIQSASYKKGKYSAKDGIDISMCILDERNKTLKYSGAHIPLYILRNGELIEHVGDKMSVGPYVKYQSFTENELKVEKGDRIYIFTDGYSDQFGGKHDRKFMKRNLKSLILEIYDSEMIEQEIVFANRLKKWMGKSEQVDDITGFGFMLI